MDVSDGKVEDENRIGGRLRKKNSLVRDSIERLVKRAIKKIETDRLGNDTNANNKCESIRRTTEDRMNRNNGY